MKKRQGKTRKIQNKKVPVLLDTNIMYDICPRTVELLKFLDDVCEFHVSLVTLFELNWRKGSGMRPRKLLSLIDSLGLKILDARGVIKGYDEFMNAQPEKVREYYHEREHDGIIGYEAYVADIKVIITENTRDFDFFKSLGISVLKLTEAVERKTSQLYRKTMNLPEEREEEWLFCATCAIRGFDLLGLKYWKARLEIEVEEFLVSREDIKVEIEVAKRWGQINPKIMNVLLQ